MTTASQSYTSLLYPLAFPPFLLCLQEYRFSSTYYSQPPPIRHWCFLGKIESISGIGHLCLDVRDREGTPTHIYFYLNRLSPSVVEVVMTLGPRHRITYPNHPNCLQHLIQKGNTIAVLYAQQHTWREPLMGIWIEDRDTVHVCIFICDILCLNELMYILTALFHSVVLSL